MTRGERAAWYASRSFRKAREAEIVEQRLLVEATDDELRAYPALLDVRRAGIAEIWALEDEELDLDHDWLLPRNGVIVSLDGSRETRTIRQHLRKLGRLPTCLRFRV